MGSVNHFGNSSPGLFRTGWLSLLAAWLLQVYKPSSKPSSEKDGKIAPFTQQAEFMARAEAAVQSVPGLPWVIVRPAGEMLILCQAMLL